MKALIIDDEPLPAKYLKELINSNCREVLSCEIITNPVLALEIIKEHDYDVIFLDVEMPKMTGIEFLKHAKLGSNTSVVFITAHENYAIEAFKSNAVHYILKPVDLEELKVATSKVKKYRELVKESEKSKQKGSITLFDGTDYRLIEFDSLIRIEASGSYSKVVLDNDSHILVSKRLGSIQKELDQEVFFRCHNSHLVNSKKIEKISKTSSTINLINGELIPLSSSYKSELNRRIKG
jgi:two-component system LytT family response regulator